MNSKALRGFDDLNPKPKSILDRLLTKLEDLRYRDGFFYDKLDTFLTFIVNTFHYAPRSFFRNLRRSVDYIKLGWNNYDWDSHYIYEVLQFKLKRTLKELESGHSIPNQYNELKALKLAIKLGDRLVEDWNHYSQFRDLHDAKWGKLDMDFEPVEDSNNLRLISSRPNANTKEEKEQELSDFMTALKKDDRRKQRDREIYFKILAKYIEYMWD